MDKADLLISKIIPESIDRIIEDNNGELFLMESNLEIKNKGDLRKKFDTISNEYLGELKEEIQEELLELKAKQYLLDYTKTTLQYNLSEEEIEKLEVELQAVEQRIQTTTKEYSTLRNLESVTSSQL